MSDNEKKEDVKDAQGSSSDPIKKDLKDALKKYMKADASLGDIDSVLTACREVYNDVIAAASRALESRKLK